MKSMRKKIKMMTFLFMLGIVALISFGFAVDAAESGYIDIVSGTGTDLGDEVRIGDEHFYILSNNGSEIRMLAKYNVDIKAKCSNNYRVENPTEDDFYKTCGERPSATGLQDSTILGIPDPTTGDVIGVPFSTSLQHGTSRLDYEGSVIQIYVNQYVDTINKKYGINVTGNLLDLEIFNKYFASYNGDFADAPETIRKLINVTSWTKVPTKDQTIVILDAVDKKYYGFDTNNFFGVKPVIIAPASALNTSNGSSSEGAYTSTSACYVCGNEYVWTDEPDDSSCKLKSNIKDENMCVNNPKTGIDQHTMMILVIISTALVVLALWSRQNRFKRI